MCVRFPCTFVICVMHAPAKLDAAFFRGSAAGCMLRPPLPAAPGTQRVHQITASGQDTQLSSSVSSATSSSLTSERSWLQVYKGTRWNMQNVSLCLCCSSLLFNHPCERSQLKRSCPSTMKCERWPVRRIQVAIKVWNSQSRDASWLPLLRHEVQVMQRVRPYGMSTPSTPKPTLRRPLACEKADIFPCRRHIRALAPSPQHADTPTVAIIVLYTCRCLMRKLTMRRCPSIATSCSTTAPAWTTRTRRCWSWSTCRRVLQGLRHVLQQSKSISLQW